MRMSWNRYRFLCCTASAFLLAGCTPSKNDSVSQSSIPQATAPALPAAPLQTAQAAQAAQLSAQQQRVQQLIAQVEKAYAAGQEDYRKGNLVDAKTQFDHAVDLMLTAGIDIKSDPQLQDEFDRIVDKVNGLEMEAL